MRYILTFLLLPLLFTVSAQDTLLITQVDTKPQLKTEDIPSAKGETGQDKLFLYGVYSSVKYPRYARENGVGAVVGVTYLVGLNGKVFIERAKAFTLAEAAKFNVPKEELITVTALSSRRVGNGPSTPVSAPRQTKHEKRLAKAHEALEVAAAVSIYSLPHFIPGKHEGKNVVVRATRLFVFNME